MGNSSLDRYHTLSKSFQQRVVNAYNPITPTSKEFLRKNSPELLVGYLAKKDVTYEDLDNSIEIIKANKKDLPFYVINHSIKKLKSDNLNLYRQYSKQFRDEYFYMMSVGVPRYTVISQVRLDNREKLNSVISLYSDNFEKIEAKINVLLPTEGKIPEIDLKSTK